MAYQYPLNGGRINASITGNTAGAYSLVSTGTLQLAGGNNITLSQAGNAITISGANAAAASIKLSAGASSASLSAITFADSNGINFGLNGSTLTASHNGLTTQSGQALSGSNGSFAFQTATFGNLNGLSFYTSNGSMVASYTVPTQSVQTIGGYATGNTTGQSSSSTFDARSMSLSAIGGVSAGYSAGMLQMAAPAVSSLSQTGIVSISRNGSTISIGAPAFSIGMSNIGNSAGTSGTISNQLVLAGGNNITLSQSTGVGGNTISIVGPTAAGASVNFSAGTTSANLASVTFANSNGIGFGLNAGTITASHNGITSQSSFSLSGNGITFNTNGSTVSASVATTYAASNHSHGNPTLNLTNLSGTTASASNGFTLSLSAAAPGGGGGAAFSAGTQSVSTGTVNFANSNGLTFGMSNSNQITASHNGITQGIQTVSIGGNTAGVGASISSGALSLYGGNNITLSQNANSLTISGAAGGGGGGVAISGGGSLYTNGTVNFSAVAGAALTISGSTNSVLSLSVPGLSSLSATGAVSISVNASTVSIGVQMFDAGVLNAAGGSTSGTMGTGNTGGLIMYAGSNVLLSQATDAGGNASVTFNAGGALPTLQRWEYPEHAFTSLSNGTMAQSILSIQHMYVPFNVTGSAMKIAGSLSIGTHTSASTGTVSANLWMGLYTLNGSTLNLATSGSASTTMAVSSNTVSLINGMRQFTIPANINMTPGEYWVAALMTTATNYNSNTMAFTLYGNNNIAGAASNAIISPIGTAITASPRDALLFQGMYTALTNGLPANIQGSQINNSSASYVQRAAFYNAIYNATY